MKFPRPLLVVFLLTLSAVTTRGQKSPVSETDLKRQAEKNFQSENYSAATPMYSQLLSLYPKDATYNYRYGVCLLQSGQDKSGAASYLETAAKSEGMDPDVHFYLGRSYMFSGQYEAAKAEFNRYKKTGAAARQMKLQPDVYLRNCEYADQLRKDRKNVAVLSRNKVGREGFFASYDFSGASGKMLTTPERFLTPMDKEKMKNPVMFMAKNGETIFYASYGKKGDQGKDIYRIEKMLDGSWGEPVSLGPLVNTPEDEDYPYLDKDGRTLYFCSRGHNSIGGYDIFKTKKDNNTGQWSDPQNVGIPINTVDDDIFFVPSVTGETAVYATAVDCETGRIELREIRLGDVVSHVAIISGKYFSQDQVTRRDARITVIRNSDNGVVTSVKTDRTGEYELVIPAGDNYSLLVEGGSYLPHVEKFYVPGGKTLQGLQQKVIMNKSGDKEEMTLSNFFEPSAADPSVASLEKPTQVTKNEFDLKDTVLTKMQAITLDGRTLYAVPPSAASLNALAKLELPSAKSQANTPEDKSKMNPQTGGAEQNITSDAPVLNPAIPEPGPDGEVAAKAVGDDEVVADKKVLPVISEKASNAELVKMAFDDAQSLNEEASTLRKNADETREDARSLDSLSKVQLKQANELLTSGQKEESQQMFKESQDNALEAEQKNKEASAMETEAGQRDAEYTSALSEAKELMKSLRVDTNAVAYQSIRKRDDANKEDLQADAGEGGEKAPGLSNSPEVLAAKAIHRERADSLNREAEKMLAESAEMVKKSEKTGDLMMRSFYEKRSKELKASAEARKTEAKRELALAENPEAEVVMADRSTDTIAKTNRVEREVTAAEKNAVSGTPEKSGETPANNNAIELPGETGKPGAGTAGVQAKTTERNATPSGNGKEAADTKTPAEIPAIESNTANAVPAAAATGTEQGNINPEALQHYQNYKNKLEHSQRIEQAAKVTEAKLTSVSIPEKRDSIESRAADMRQKSIQEWQDAQMELTMAKRIDPDVVEKMKSIEPVADNKEKEAAGNATKEEKAVSAPVVQKVDRAAEPEKEIVKEEKQPVPEILDTTSEDYPRYVEVQKEIFAKQSETVDFFIQGIRLNNQADSIKKIEMKYRDQAVVAKNKNERSKLEEKADSLAMEADILSNRSKALLNSAQKNTGKVNDLTAKSEQLKERLMIAPPEAAAIKDAAVESKPTADQRSGTDTLPVSTKPVPLNESGPDTLAVTTKPIPVQEITGETVAITAPSEPETPKDVSADKEQVQQQVKEAEVMQKPEESEEEVNEPLQAKADQGPGISEKDSSGNDLSPVQLQAGNETSEVRPAEDSVKRQTVQPADLQTEFPSGQPVTENAVPAADEINYAAANATKASEKTETFASQNQVDLRQYEVPVSNDKLIELPSDAELKFTTEIRDAQTFALDRKQPYTAANPIPMNPSLPEGLVFKVQIGAFRKPLPANAFNNLQPLTGETSRPGWIRYCLGLFRSFEPANLLKKEVRGMGYPDAFVVAYYNGKRIPLYEAYGLIAKSGIAAKQSYAAIAASEFSQLEKFEIRKSSFSEAADNDENTFFGRTERSAVESTEYAVQVGVYKSANVPAALRSLQPLSTEAISSGRFRFTTGRFDNRVSADSMKQVAINAGVKDAFVVIYRSGMKTAVPSGTPAQSQQNLAVSTPQQTPAVANESTAQAAAAPGKIWFKVQIGAFRESIPLSKVTSFLQVAAMGITQETDSRGLHLFYAGNYNSFAEAASARAEIVSKGINDAFIVGFVEGRRTTASEAQELLNRK